MTDNILLALTRIGIFGALTPSDQRRLASLLKEKSFSPNQTIFIQGEEGRGLYLIRTGKIKICANDRQGNELIFSFLTSRDILGEIAILDGLPRSATAIAVTQTNTYYLDRKDFLEFLETSPRVCFVIIANLCKSLRRVSTHLEEVSFLDVSGRVARNLLTLAAKDSLQTMCIISQEELAKVVGASRVIVNKILNSFVELGFITLARKKIIILNEHELDRIGSYNLDI